MLEYEELLRTLDITLKREIGTKRRIIESENN